MKQRGQTALEYVYLIGVVAAAIIVMLVYVSRGFQGRLRVQADQLGGQYSPKDMSTSIKQVTIADSTTTIKDKETTTHMESTTTTAKGSYEKTVGF